MQPLIGGHKAVVVNRTRTGDGSKPEFLSLTVFPGRAMNLFQVTAWISGKGEIDLIHSPSIEEAARILCDARTILLAQRTPHSAEHFWPRLQTGLLVLHPRTGEKVSFTWKGRPMTLDANWGRLRNRGPVPYAIHGLILKEKAERVRVISSGDKQTISGVIRAGNFAGHWFSKTDLTISISLQVERCDRLR